MTRRDYEVGYGKPPRQHRFKPGQSGNPGGRPKGTKNLKSDLADELKESITITEGGKPRKLSKQRALLKSLVARALKGDNRAAGVIISMVDRYLTDPSDSDPHEQALNENDRLILEAFRAEILAEAKREQE